MLFETFLAQALSSPAPPAPQPLADPPAAVCPDGMRLVEGTHHDQVQRLCTSWRLGHCYAFLDGTRALESAVTPIRTCMDELEWPNREGAMPEVMMRFVEAEQKCASVGKRMCTEYEWEMACEGPEHLPWPYGHTYDPEACNTEKKYRPYSAAKLGSAEHKVREGEVSRLWQGERSGARKTCGSPFGVRDMVGNVEEWVQTSRPEWRYPSSLKGGFWSKPWASCRGTNDSHGPMFRFYEIGFRCCKDPAQ